MSQAFYRKWRPQTWDEVVAQEHVITTLRNAVRTGRFAHAYLLAGPRGTGKTTTARLLAKALNCLHKDPAKRPCDKCEHCKAIDEGRFLDLIEIDAASNTSVEDVRDLRDKINFRPSQGQYKVYIIDEVHMLSTAAFNALLKTLEEPPEHAIFILATTEVHKIPATILSRCQRYEFRRIPVPEIMRHLKKMAAEEKLKVDDDALLLIARQATGAMRDAISLLDQLASTGEDVTLVVAQQVLGTATSALVVELVEAMITREPGRGMICIQAALDTGTDARQFARQVVDYLRSLMLVRMGNADQIDATHEMREQMAVHARAFELPRLLEAIRLFNAAAVDARASWHPGLALELAFAESIEEKQPVYAEQAAQSAQSTQSTGAQAYTPPAAQRSVSPAPAMREAPPPAEGTAQSAPQRPQPAANPPQRQQMPQQAQPQQRQPAQQQQPQPAAQPPAPGKAITQNDVQANWNRIRQQVKSKNSLTAAALNSVRSFNLKDNTLILGFQTEVVKSKMETPENIEILRQALQLILGVQMSIRCVVVGNKGGSPAGLDIDSDGIVGTALDLGGKIAYEE